jgi:hypothetical protein
VSQAPPPPCPTCGRPPTAEERPFCSRRCRLIDLGGWLDGRRGIPVRDDESDGRPGEEEGER